MLKVPIEVWCSFLKIFVEKQNIIALENGKVTISTSKLFKCFEIQVNIKMRKIDSHMKY
jgi:hypothetical protein